MSISLRIILDRSTIIWNGAIYTTSLLIQRAIAILLLPIYIRSLSPSEYGDIAIIISISSAVVTVLTFGLDSAILRNYHKLAESPEQRQDFLSTVGIFLLITPTILILACLGAMATLRSSQAQILSLGLMTAALQVATTVFSFALLRSQEKPWAYARLNLQYSCVLSIGLIVLVVALDGGTTGWLLANILAWTTLLPDTLLILKRNGVGKVNFRQLRFALLFGLPLVPHAMSHWGLAISDRLVLSAWVSSAEIGIYNLGYQAAAVLGLIHVGVCWGVMPLYARIKSETGSIAELKPVIALQIGLALVLGICWAVFVPYVVRLLLPASYDESARIVPWVVLGYTFYALYLIPINLLALVLGETRWVWAGTAAALAVNIGFNVAMVPRHGIEAAAVSTALAYATLFAVTSTLWLQKHQQTAARRDSSQTVLGTELKEGLA